MLPSTRRTRGAAVSTRLARSAGLIGLATMTSRVLGVVRELVLAALFGAGDAMDAFFVAFRIPNLVRDLFAEGAMSAAFVPTFTRYLTTRGRAAAWRLGNLVVTALLLVTGALVLAGIVFARPLVWVLASDYADVDGKLELTITLTRIMLPFLTMVAVAVAMMGMLNSLRRFFVPALSPAMFNIAIILSAFVIVPLMPRVGLPAIAGIAFGALLGGLGQILIQWPVLRREGYRTRLVVDTRDEGLREVLLLIGVEGLDQATTAEIQGQSVQQVSARDVAAECHPSPSRAARRMAAGLSPPTQIGTCGFCTGLGANPQSSIWKYAPAKRGCSSVHRTFMSRRYSSMRRPRS